MLESDPEGDSVRDTPSDSLLRPVGISEGGDPRVPAPTRGTVVDVPDVSVSWGVQSGAPLVVTVTSGYCSRTVVLVSLGPDPVGISGDWEA